jgi:tetratricopeptide (TPR) repeat protein
MPSQCNNLEQQFTTSAEAGPKPAVGNFTRPGRCEQARKGVAIVPNLLPALFTLLQMFDAALWEEQIYRGRRFQSVGKYPEAESAYRVALDHARQLGPEHLLFAASLSDLATLHYDQGQYVEAASLHRQALIARERILGRDHLETAATQNNLALALTAIAQLAEAEHLYIDSLGTTEKHLGSGHLEVAIKLRNLAELYLRQGRLDIAEPLQQRALAIREKEVGPDNPALVGDLTTLGALRKAGGNSGRQKSFTSAHWPSLHRQIARVIQTPPPLSTTSPNCVSLKGRNRKLKTCCCARSGLAKTH